MTRTLDKNRPYGTIYGTDERGGVFEQDGCRFNQQGVCVWEPPDAAKPAQAPSPAPSGDDQLTKEELQDLHATKVSDLAEKLGLEPETGSGSKARNIANILALQGS